MELTKDVVLEKLRSGGKIENQIAVAVEAIDKTIGMIADVEKLSMREAVAIKCMAQFMRGSSKTILEVAAFVSLKAMLGGDEPKEKTSRPDFSGGVNDAYHREGKCGCVLCDIEKAMNIKLDGDQLHGK